MKNDNIEVIDLNYTISDNKLKKKNRKSKIVLSIIISIFLVIILVYAFIIIKFSFSLKQDEIIMKNGSNYQIELNPKFIKNFDYENYIFEVQDSSIVTISKLGNIISKNIGETEIIVKYKYSIFSKKIKISVQDIDINSINVIDDINIKTDESIRINPVINNNDKIYANLTFESNDVNIVKVDNYGNVTSVSPGETSIKIKCDNIIEEVKVKVNSTIKEIEKISLVDNNITLKKGSKMKLISMIEPMDATDTKLTWTSNSGNAVVDNYGTVIGNQFGVSIITVETSNGKKATCTVMILDSLIKVTDLSLDKTNLDMKVGEMYQLIPTILPNNATLRNLSWTSSNPKVATVNNGKILAKKKGKTTITVKSLNNKIATCEVFIKEKEIKAKEVKLSINNAILNVGDVIILRPTIIPNDTVNKNITWTSSNKQIATVENGKVIAKKEGVAVITAKTSNNKTANSIIIVKNNIYN